MGELTKINWSERFNALGPKIRIIGCAAEAKLRIQHLNFEKSRLKKRYDQSVAEINSHIKNCERHLADLEKEILTTEKTL